VLVSDGHELGKIKWIIEKPGNAFIFQMSLFLLVS
jgi:hypothetical protein